MKTYLSHIGYFAQQVLDRSNGALVSGISSRGIYLQPEADWTLYLSLEKYRGPLTLNLEGDLSWLNNVKTGSPVHFSAKEIHFPQNNSLISIKNAILWHPCLESSASKLIPGQVAAVLSLFKKLAAENPFLPLLSKNSIPVMGLPGIKENILGFENALKSGDLTNIADQLTRLLGLGPGLTPLGDDFILGVLLTLNHRGTSIPKEQHIKDLNPIIIQHALEKTTRLSASLLACAAEGAADERLLKVLDSFYSEREISEGDLRDLLAWGSSSGIAVLAGMILALS